MLSVSLAPKIPQSFLIRCICRKRSSLPLMVKIRKTYLLKQKKKERKIISASDENPHIKNPVESLQFKCNINVSSNIGKCFFTILDKHFLKSHSLHKIFNRNNVKISYSSMPNIASIINSHNKKVINDKNHQLQLATVV